MRLNLDFKLDTTQERLDYLTDYIQDKNYTLKLQYEKIKIER